MPLQIGRRPDHGFDQPLGLLSDCHRRIEHFLGVLLAVVAEGPDGTLPPEHRGALEGALRYFAEAAPKHTADEEESLFPRLRNNPDPALADSLAALDALEQDHERAEADHAAVDEIGRRWLETGSLPAPDVHQLGHRLERLQSLYARHISIEDNQVFPAAGRALDGEQLAKIGSEMARRRGTAPER